MIVPIVICCVCLLCLEGEHARRPVRKPRKRERIDALLCAGLAQGLDAAELVALVLRELYPGRTGDERMARQVTNRVRRRLNAPDFIRRCRRSNA